MVTVFGTGPPLIIHVGSCLSMPGMRIYKLSGPGKLNIQMWETYSFSGECIIKFKKE